MQRKWAKNLQDWLSVDFSAEAESKDEIKQALLQYVRRQESEMNTLEKSGVFPKTI